VNDAELVALSREGDTAAFGELVDRHRAAVYRAALAALGSHVDAEDAAQDAFFIAYERLPGFRGDASFKTWLLTIAWRQAINRRRALTRLWRLITSPARHARDDRSEPSDVASEDPSPEDLAAAGELRRSIAVEIRRLSPVLRDTLLLAQSGDHTYDEIAAMLRVPVGTVKWRVSEARKMIRKRLKERGIADVG
jgi:RNA polymerase sigma-70 factor (ECF subfamily)